MIKEQIMQDGYYFWAKKFDRVACITSDKPGEYKTLCGSYNALLGNNYQMFLNNICPKCLKIYEDAQEKK